jgi:hypothetical protein
MRKQVQGKVNILFGEGTLSFVVLILDVYRENERIKV